MIAENIRSKLNTSTKIYITSWRQHHFFKYQSGTNLAKRQLRIRLQTAAIRFFMVFIPIPFNKENAPSEEKQREKKIIFL